MQYTQVKLETDITDLKDDFIKDKTVAVPFEYVGVKEEVESSDVKINENKTMEYVTIKEEVDEEITVVKHEVENYNENVVVVQPENMVLHSKENETGEKLNFFNSLDDYTCEYCDKSFKKKPLFNRHLRTHKKLHRCEICDCRFAGQYNLKVHMRRHTGERPYVCTVCGKSFHSNKTFKAHERTHNENKRHICPICKKGYNTIFSFTVHTRTHTGERPYQCEICEKKFMAQSNLIQHQRTHSGVRNFECDICKKRFVQKQTLYSHRKIHFCNKQHIVTQHKDVHINTVVINTNNTSVVDIKKEPK